MSETIRFYTLAIQSSPAAVGTARDWLRELGAQHGLGEEPQYSLDLCANELLANIVEHGSGGPTGEIRLEFSLEQDAVRLTVIDNGPPFDPLSHPVPPLSLSLATTSAGGRGLFLARQFAEAFHYERVDDCNRSTVRIPTAR